MQPSFPAPLAREQLRDMDDMLEIRWHARGGQGAKTASILLAEAASAAGKYIQGFPEYGPERMGAPILAFNRISDSPLRLHCHVARPKVVLVLDPTLMGKAPIIDGLPDDGAVIVNTPSPPQDVRKVLKMKHGRAFTVDASGISLATIGRDIPNTPMMSALMRVTGLMDFESFMRIMREQLESKFKSKAEIVEGNMSALERGYREVRGE